MTQQQKTIKLAEFEGWKLRKATFWERVFSLGSLRRITTTPSGQEFCGYFPKYFQDLNAVRKLEEKLTDQWTDYLNNLYYITFKPAAKDRDKQAIHASAEDKCEALGKTLKLWS